MEVTSAPYLVDPVQFGLKDFEDNRRKLQELYKKYPHEQISIYNDLPLVEFKISSKESYIVAISDEEEIVYLVHLKAEKLLQLHSNSVTQVEVWRRAGNSSVTGLAKFVVFEILLHRYNYIVSDASQSDDGKRFWLDLLGKAVNSGHKVGVMFGTNPVDWQEDSSFKMWLRFIESEAWGHNLQKHFYYRFVIAA
jgi:hypothetical protein